MSYQPPSQPGGDVPPDDSRTGQGSDAGSTGDYGGQGGQGGYTPPPGGQPTQPVGGGYGAPPPDQGGYTPPPGGGYSPPPGGGYNPPPGGGYSPPQGGGYSPPPGGGYSPPPGGGYNPPPGGGYNPPPGGGYGGPPPPPPGGGMGGPNMSSLNRNVTIGSSQFNPADLLQSWMNAVTKPNVSTYESEMPKASWIKVLVGIALVAVVGFIVNLIFASAAASTYNAILDQLRAQGNTTGVDTFNNYRWAFGGGSAITSLISPFITFFIGAGVLYLLAKMLGGQGNDFMTHSYLLSISYAPLRTVAALLNIVPVIGGCIGFLLVLYQIYSAGLSMQASQRMPANRAQLAAWIPVIVLLVLGCACAVLFLGLLGAAISNSGR